MSNTEPIARVLVLGYLSQGNEVYQRMRQFGVEVDHSHHIVDAIAFASKMRYAALIADIEDAADENLAFLIKKIRPDLPVIAVADGGSPIKDMETALRYGFSGYLHKPFEFPEALEAVAGCIDEKEINYIG